MPGTPAILVIEDDLSLFVVKRILRDIDSRYYIEKTIPEIRRKNVTRGNAYIKEKISAFNKAAQYKNFIVLTDLDTKECAPGYVAELIDGSINQNLILQIAVREVETWLLADRNNFASYLGVSKDLFKIEPESIADPKSYIFSIVKKSGKRSIKNGILPIDTTAGIGPRYNQLLIEFVNNYWDFNMAKSRSVSLARFINKLGK